MDDFVLGAARRKRKAMAEEDLSDLSADDRVGFERGQRRRSLPQVRQFQRSLRGVALRTGLHFCTPANILILPSTTPCDAT